MISKNILDPQERYRYLQVLLERPIAYHRIFAKIAGSVTAGLFLSQLFYWTPRGKDEDSWIYKTAKEWYEETALTRREQETARRLLKQKKLLQEKKCGVPCKLFYRINTEVLLETIAAQTSSESGFEGVEDTVQTRMAESAKLERRKAPNKNGGKRQTKMAESAKLERRKAPNRNGGKRQTEMAESAKHSIYTETTSETTSETTHIHSPPPPTQESVCKENSSGQEEVTEILSSSVDQKKEELNPTHQTLQRIKDSAAPIENGSRYQNDLDGSDHLPWETSKSPRQFEQGFEEWMSKSLSDYPAYQGLINGDLITKVRKHISAGKYDFKRRDELLIEWDAYSASKEDKQLSQPLTAPSYTIRKPPSPEEKAAEQKEKLLRRIRNTPKGNKRLIPDCLPELVRSGELALSEVPQWMQEVMEF